VDYKSATFAKEVEEAAKGKVELVVDCISITHTFELITQVIRPGGSIAWLAPFKAGSGSLAGSDGELLFEIPMETQAIFPQAVNFICVRTFHYQQVRIFRLVQGTLDINDHVSCRMNG
jgi:threonine dehydrogenase-like Zn-dependent dehydrogenase